MIDEREAEKREEVKARLDSMPRYKAVIDAFPEHLSLYDLEEIVRCLDQVVGILRPQGVKALKAVAAST